MKRVVHHLRRASSLLIGTPSRLSNEIHDKRIFTAFAKKQHLVYFSSIDTSANDTQVVRGITLGLSSGDKQHMFGSHDGYDMAVVQRQGETGSGRCWLVMQFDLHTAVNLPHMIIGKETETRPLFESLLGIHRDLQLHLFADPQQHHGKFNKHFVTYASPAHAPLVEHVVSPELTNALVDHIQHIVIEIEGDSIYLIVDRPSLSVQYLDKMMHYGIQFAKHIDEKMGAA